MADDTRINASSPRRSLPDDLKSAFTGERSRRQLRLWAGGAGFMLLSAFITRRAINRRYRSIRPAFFHYSHEPPPVTFNGPLEALEALSISTINVFSFGMMMTGGACWAFDIGSLKELRERTRKRLGYEDAIAKEQGADGGITQDEWVHNTLTKEDEERQQRKNGT